MDFRIGRLQAGNLLYILHQLDCFGIQHIGAVALINGKHVQGLIKHRPLVLKELFDILHVFLVIKQGVLFILQIIIERLDVLNALDLFHQLFPAFLHLFAGIGGIAILMGEQVFDAVILTGKLSGG